MQIEVPNLLPLPHRPIGQYLGYAADILTVRPVIWQVRNGYTAVAEDVLAAACLLAALCTIALPIETKGRALTVHRGCAPQIYCQGLTSPAAARVLFRFGKVGFAAGPRLLMRCCSVCGRASRPSCLAYS